MTRNYNRSAIVDHLRNHSLTMKEMADWVGMSETGLSLALKKQSEEGFSDGWVNIITSFMVAKGRGRYIVEREDDGSQTVKHEIFNPELFE